MDTENFNIETKCENLMNIVVESRKQLGKICKNYNQKILLMENKILSLHIENISNCHLKPKNVIPEINSDACKDIDDFLLEVAERQKRMEDIRKKIKNTHEVILQLQTDIIGVKLKTPLIPNVMLAKAKSKNV